MNILFVNGKYPNFGGTEKITTILANAFVERGDKVSIASFEQPHPELSSDLAEGVEIISLTLPVKSQRNLQLLRNTIHQKDIDIIMNQWCLPFYVTQLLNKARKGTKAKLLSNLHGIPDRSAKVIAAREKILKSKGLSKIFAKVRLKLTDEIIRWSVRYVYKHSDRYVVLSKGFIQSLKEYGRLTDISKAFAIGNPITIATNFDSLVFSIKKKQLMYLGRISREDKRVDRVIDVWQTLYREYPDWNLCLVGDGPQRSLLEQHVKDNNIERVTFTGYVNNALNYYRESSVLLLTSDLEGFGLVVVEGMSHGVIPVVYGSYLSIYDMIESGKQGYITSVPFSVDEMASRVRSLMDDETLRQTMGRNSIERSKYFRLDRIVDTWYDLFHSLM